MKYNNPDIDVNDQEAARMRYEDSSRNLIIPMDPEVRKILEAVDRITNNKLLTQHHVRNEVPFVALTTTICFLESLIEALASMKAETVNGKAVHFNLMDLLEFNISYMAVDGEKDGNLQLKVAPGVEAKLLIKGDNITEEE